MSQDPVNVQVSIEGTLQAVPTGTPIASLLPGKTNQDGVLVVAAIVDNEIRELGWEIREDCSIRFVDLRSEDGVRIYQRSLKFLLLKALHDCYPDRDVAIRHSVSKGIFFDVLGPALSDAEIISLGDRMRELVDKDLPFRKVTVSLEEARHVFQDAGRLDRLRAIHNREKDYVSLYLFEDVEDYF